MSSLQPQRQYDFSPIFMLQQNIKSSFRNLKLQSMRLKSGLKRSQDKFFRKIVKEKRNVYLRDLSGYSNNRAEMTSQTTNTAFLTPFTQKQAQSQPTIPVENQLKKFDGLASDKTIIERETQQTNGHSTATHHTTLQRDISTHSQQQQPLRSQPLSNNPFDFSSMSHAKMTQQNSKPLDEVSYLMAFREDVLDEKEKALFIREDEKSEEIRIAKMLCTESNDLRTVKIHDFRRYMCCDIILDYCAHKLYDKVVVYNIKHKIEIDKFLLNEIKDLLRTIDKYLFVMFRNCEITLDQLKARLAEKNQNVVYTVLDDLRGTLQPDILEGVPEEVFFQLYKSEIKDGKRVVPLKEIMKGLQPWQTDKRCLRSLYYQQKKSNIKPNKINQESKDNIQELIEQNNNNLTKRVSHQSQSPDKQQNKSLSQTSASPDKSQSAFITQTNPYRTTNANSRNAKQQPKNSMSLGARGVRYRLPSKKEARDYKCFVTQMTEKIKTELSKEIVKKTNRDRNSILKDSFSEKKELLKALNPEIPQEKTVKQDKKELFHASGLSHTIKNIREVLTKENQRIQEMLFLKQLEADGESMVVWEKGTLNLMNHIESEKQRINNTDYSKILKPRKPRVAEILSGASTSSNTYHIQTNSSSTFRTHSTSLLQHKRGYNNSVTVDPNQNLIKIEEEETTSGVGTVGDPYTDDPRIFRTPLKGEQQQYSPDKFHYSSDKMRKIQHYNFLADQQQQQYNSLNKSKHLQNSSITNGINITTATSISNDEYIVSNINSNRSLLQKNPPLYYQKSSPSYNIGVHAQKESTYYNIPILQSFKHQNTNQPHRGYRPSGVPQNDSNISH